MHLIFKVPLVLEVIAGIMAVWLTISCNSVKFSIIYTAYLLIYICNYLNICLFIYFFYFCTEAMRLKCVTRCKGFVDRQAQISTYLQMTIYIMSFKKIFIKLYCDANQDEVRYG